MTLSTATCNVHRSANFFFIVSWPISSLPLSKIVVFFEVNAQYGCCVWSDIHSELLGPGNELNNLLRAFHSCHKEHHQGLCSRYQQWHLLQNTVKWSSFCMTLSTATCNVHRSANFFFIVSWPISSLPLSKIGVFWKLMPSMVAAYGGIFISKNYHSYLTGCHPFHLYQLLVPFTHASTLGGTPMWKTKRTFGLLVQMLMWQQQGLSHHLPSLTRQLSCPVFCVCCCFMLVEWSGQVECLESIYYTIVGEFPISCAISSTNEASTHQHIIMNSKE